MLEEILALSELFIFCYYYLFYLLVTPTVPTVCMCSQFNHAILLLNSIL